MLVLSRKAGESIRIGPDVTIVVLGVQGGRVRLGITAPADTPVWRSELVLDAAVLPVKQASWEREAHRAAVC